MKICFLWHFHQPDYRKGNRFFLPWVRLHGVKDYHDIPATLAASGLKHTINLVPSLLSQLDDYGRGVLDPIQELCTIEPRDRSDEQRKELVRWIGSLQFQHMVEPLPRLAELWDKIQHSSREGEPVTLSDQEFTDAEVLFHLAWTGPNSRELPVAKRLLQQGAAFTRLDLFSLLTEHEKLIGTIVGNLVNIQTTNAVEISVSPFHHPILPLLIDSDSAKECMPHSRLPNPAIMQGTDAAWHVFAAADDWLLRSGIRPRGMWPSEGSVSMDTLRLMVSAGFSWTATDEAVLRRSLGEKWSPASHLVPYEVHTAGGPIRMLFRDHELSDAIGFTYASWNANDAVEDFIQKLQHRQELVTEYVPQELHDSAVIPIILDGENCWEYYPENGREFLNKLFDRLGSMPMFTSVTGSEATSSSVVPLSKISAGSWINADFDIWIGSSVKNRAWELLDYTRNVIQEKADPPDLVEKIRALQASDYFWWYDQRHVAPHKHEFDEAFRSGLRSIIEVCAVPCPDELNAPLEEFNELLPNQMKVFAVTYGDVSTMHVANTLVKEVTIETSENWQKLAFRLYRWPESDESIDVTLSDRHGLERVYHLSADGVLFRSPLHDEGIEHNAGDALFAYVHASGEWNLHIKEMRKNGTMAHAALHMYS